MNYIYPPMYKYIAFILIIFLFMGHYKVITQPNYLLVSIVGTATIFLLDHFLIENHPGLLHDETNSSKSAEDILDKLVDDTESKSRNSEDSPDNLDDLDDDELLTDDKN